MTALHDVKPLSIHGLSKSYGPLRAVDSLDIGVARGSIVGLVGPNGSGKTTTLRIVVGLLEPDAGRVLVNGLEQGSLAARAQLAYVPDEPAGLDELTIAEFLDLYAALHRAGEIYRTRSETLLSAFGLDTRARTSLASLSHGMRRQVSVVAAFALAPALVVVDEATAALDPEAVIVLREALRALVRGGSGILLATQDLHFAETVCDRVSLLSRGRLVDEGTVSTLQGKYHAASLEAVFLNALGQSSLVDELRDSLGSL